MRSANSGRALRRRPGARGPAIGTVLVAAAAAVAAAVAMAMPANAATTLRSLAEAKGRYFGTALTASSDSREKALAAQQFDMVTAGNEMKWTSTEPSKGNFTFAAGDAIASFAKSHNMRVRGHTLVWHNQIPSWIINTPSSQVQAAMEGHIKGVMTHYKGQIYAWDVINEPFNSDGSLRHDVFYNAMGTSYLAIALRAAHAADPAAKLYINDYSIEGKNAKSDALYNLAKSLRAQGVPLGGIGFQGHFVVGGVPSSLQANLQRFADLGLNVAITELDDRILLPATSANLQTQANDYRTVIKACLAVTRCVGISQWQVYDGHSWIPGTFPGYGAALMYDSNYQPKPAYYAAVSALSG